MSEPIRPAEPDAPAPTLTQVPTQISGQVPGQAPGQAPTSGDPAASDDPIRRKLLMGLALLLALTSIYAGVFNVGRLAQIVLAAAATMAMVSALMSGSRRNS
jgi:hypothetical protein